MTITDDMKKQTIGMASDHAGYELKEQLKPFLKELGYKIKDFGAHSAESMDYADTAHPLAEAVEKGEVDFGIAMCGSGNGISALAKQHNNANIITLPARFISEELARETVLAYLNATFEGGRHQRRIDKIPCR